MYATGKVLPWKQWIRGSAVSISYQYHMIEYLKKLFLLTPFRRIHEKNETNNIEPRITAKTRFDSHSCNTTNES